MKVFYINYKDTIQVNYPLIWDINTSVQTNAYIHLTNWSWQR